MDDTKQQSDTAMPPQEEAVPVAIPSRKNDMPTREQLAVALGILVLFFGASYIPYLAKEDATPEVPRLEASVAPEEVPVKKDHFEGVSVTAQSAYVWDVKNQRTLYNKNAGVQMPLASVTKLMTALIAYETLDENARISIAPEAVLQEGDSGLAAGETFTRSNLTDLALVASSNDGAYALALASGATLARQGERPLDAFLSAMNMKAESLGLSQSFFSNPTGLDVDGAVSGSYGSARDMAFLMEYLVLNHPELLGRTREPAITVQTQTGAVLNAVNTNEVVREVPGLIGSKTGFTELAGGNLVLAYDAGLDRPIIIAVLGSTRDGRFSDMMTLIERTARTFADE